MEYAIVAPDVPGLDASGLHYRIPASLSGRALPGARVVVPLLSREVTGVILGLDRHCPVAVARELLRVLDDEPVYREGLLAVGRTVSRHYAAPLATVLRAMLPAEVRYRGHTVYALAGDRSPPEARELSPAASRILETLSDHQFMTQKELARDHPVKDLSRLVALGLIERKTFFPAPARAGRLLQVELAVPTDRAREAAQQDAGRAPRRSEWLRRLVAAGGRLPAAGMPKTVRDRLSQQGLVRTVDVEVKRRPAPGMHEPADVPTLTGEQELVLRSLGDHHRCSPGVTLLHGVTGSGKTEIYLRWVGQVLQHGRQAIVLVPEIGLTPQILGRFQQRFGDQVAVLHSGLSAGERYDEWRRIQGGEARVIVGARSAVFAPVEHLGAIIVDEEHEYSYKQEEAPRYHAREVAVMRGRAEKAPVILGSATPALETYTRALTGEYQLLTLSRRVDGGDLPPVTVVDLRSELKDGNRSMFSRQLAHALEATVHRGARAMLFLNRRGFHSFVLCRECGLVVRCPQCAVSLTAHRQGRALWCHYCDYRQRTPDVCPGCGSRQIKGLGAGTERVEQEVHQRLPGARVLRMDRDTTGRAGAHQKLLEEFRSTPAAVLVGTQMIAKGLDIPGVELVGVALADTALHFPDFRSAERTFQLISQVGGRSGRGGPGSVLVQTYHPQHYAIQAAAAHDYQGFYRQELAWRKQADFPPFTHLVHLVFSSSGEAEAERAARRAVDRGLHPKVRVLGPSPAPLYRLHGLYRWQVLLSGSDRGEVLEVAGTMQKVQPGPRVRVTLDADPISMM
ncbi:MAG TPA: primosomal protein N' [Clostridiales bacterium UBA8153]|nr:primosomal protein N' [Clostridiales bacterium UBA8153]